MATRALRVEYWQSSEHGWKDGRYAVHKVFELALCRLGHTAAMAVASRLLAFSQDCKPQKYWHFGATLAFLALFPSAIILYYQAFHSDLAYAHPQCGLSSLAGAGTGRLLAYRSVACLPDACLIEDNCVDVN